MSNFTIPFGNSKGTPIEEANDRDLHFCLDVTRKKLIEEPNGKYSQHHKEWAAAAERELARRDGGEAPSAPRQQAQAQAPRSIVKIGDGGLIKTAADAMKKIAELQGTCHLVNSPSVGCGIPDGCAVSWSVTYINVDRDTYPIKGDGAKVGIGKDALNSVAMGMGVQWNPVLSRRLDDGSHPYYCRYLAVGKMRDSDGTWITIFDEKENDLREGSAQIADMTEKQLKQQRSNIYSLTITKARNRAIRGRGVKTSYPKTELEKPFVAFKLVFTGESNDPEIRRMKARSMLESVDTLFGQAAPTPPALKPPPVDTTGTDIDDDEYGPNGVDATGTDGDF